METARPVGRDRELDAIETFLLADGASPVALLLRGEAGIGKTTLWRVVVDRATDLSHRVMLSRAAEVEAQLPFVGLGDLLRASAPDVLGELPAPQRQAVETALLLAEPGGPAPPPHAIAAATLGAFRALARAAPVLVAVDDVQWLDSPSAAALEYALRRVTPDERITFAMSWRAESSDRLPLGLERLHDGAIEQLELTPLSLGALHQMVALTLGKPLPRPLLVRVHEISGGNPYFALELARVVHSRGLSRAEHAIPLPASITETLRERLAALPAPTREALLSVAALSTPTIAAVDASVPGGARPALQAAIDGGLLVVDGDRLRFAHPLAAAAVYSEAWPEQRRACHEKLAETVQDPDERARHLALAAGKPSAELARTLESAAHRARRRGAPEAAATLAEQAWRATPGSDREGAWRRGYLAAEYHLQASDVGRLRSVTDELLSSARSGDERSKIYALLSLVPAETESEVELLDRARAAAESTGQRQSVESDLVAVTTLQGKVEEGGRHARESLRLAEQLGDPATLADALLAVARTEQVQGRGLRRDLLTRADALISFRETDGVEETVNLARSTFSAVGLLMTADEFGEARRRLAELQKILERQGLFQHVTEVLRTRAELECWAGDAGPARHYATACRELAEQTGRASKIADGLYTQAFVEAHWGDPSAARELATAGVSAAEASGNRRNLLRSLSVLGLTDLSLDEHAAAARHLQRASDEAASAGYAEPGWLRFHGDLAEARIGLGELEAAAAVVEWLEARGTVTRYPWTLATALRCRGALSAAEGDLDAAVATLEAAVAAAGSQGSPFEIARARLALGRALRRSRRQARALVELEAACAAFETMGSPVWADIARREAARVPGRRSTDPDELTPAECRIADLVAEGRSNKEVAAALVISVKTVEVTLTRVYRKLGTKNRAELARTWAVQPKQ